MFKKKKEEVAPVSVLEVISKGEWMQKYWRPCAAFMYMICCLADFAVFPIMFTVVQFWETQAANDAFRQWVPITLQGGGLFHVSMCAVLGVSAYGRTQEKLAGQSSVPPAEGLPSPTLSSTPPGGTNNASFNTPSSGAPAFGAAPTNGFSQGTPAAFSGTSPAGFGGSAPSDSSGGNGFGAATSASNGFGGGFGGQTTLATTAGGKKIVPDQPQPLL
jgi:hypothetical protein